jgi:hypothetical protein
VHFIKGYTFYLTKKQKGIKIIESHFKQGEKNEKRE